MVTRMDAHFETHRGLRVAVVPLSTSLLTVGRAVENDVVIEETTVSRLHAVVQRFRAGWCVRDLGSLNGTFVNGQRLNGARVLHDGDEVMLGRAFMVFRCPGTREIDDTMRVDGTLDPPTLTRREQEVLTVLCQPLLLEPGLFPEPPSVRQMAAELFVSESAIKKHLANLYDRFGLHGSRERRRTRLAAEAIRRRAVRQRLMD
jgi:FHA domain